MVGTGEPWIEGFQLAARTGPAEGIAFVLMVVVVVETVVASVMLTVDWRQVYSRGIDAVAFREAENVAL